MCSRSILVVQGDRDRAAEIVAEALTLARATADPYGMASALTTLGVIAQARGDYDGAAECLTSAFAQAQLRVDDPRLPFRSRARSTRISRSRLVVSGVLGRRRRTSRSARGILRAIGSRLGEVVSIGDFGDVARDEGNMRWPWNATSWH